MIDPLLRSLFTRAGDNQRLKDVAMAQPAVRERVQRFVPGETLDDCFDAVNDLAAKGIQTTIDQLGEDTTDRAHAESIGRGYLDVLHRVADLGLGSTCEVSVKLSAIGQALPGGESMARDLAAGICAAAHDAGTTVTLDMEDHTTTDSTLAILRDLRADFPSTGAVLQAYLRRTAADCADLAGEGSRVRLCKGAYLEPESVAFADKHEVDLSYARCLRILMQGRGYPMVATHDPRLIDIADELATRLGRRADSYEFQMLYGIRLLEQRRLVDTGHQMRVYVPFGADWYRYYLRRLGERPANVVFFGRSLLLRR